MKVTKLKKGYRINLSDKEFDVLAYVMMPEVFASDMFYNADYGHLSPSLKRIMGEIIDGKRNWLDVTEDRRSD